MRHRTRRCLHRSRSQKRRDPFLRPWPAGWPRPSLSRRVWESLSLPRLAPPRLILRAFREVLARRIFGERFILAALVECLLGNTLTEGFALCAAAAIRFVLGIVGTFAESFVFRAAPKRNARLRGLGSFSLGGRLCRLASRCRYVYKTLRRQRGSSARRRRACLGAVSAGRRHSLRCGNFSEPSQVLQLPPGVETRLWRHYISFGPL